MINYTSLDFNIRKHKLDCSIYTIKYKYCQNQWKTKLSIIRHISENIIYVMLHFLRNAFYIK